MVVVYIYRVLMLGEDRMLTFCYINLNEPTSTFS